MERKVTIPVRLLILPLVVVAAMLLAGAAGYLVKANAVARPATSAPAAQPVGFSELSPVTASPAQAQPSAAPVPQTAPVDEAAEAAGQTDPNEATEPADANDNQPETASQPETDNQPEASDPAESD